MVRFGVPARLDPSAGRVTHECSGRRNQVPRLLDHLAGPLDQLVRGDGGLPLTHPPPTYPALRPANRALVEGVWL